MSNDINKDDDNTEEKDNNTKENKDTTIKIDPDVVEVALEFAYREYMNEEDRKKNLETKTSYMVAIMAILGTLVSTRNSIDIFKLLNQGDKLLFVLFPLIVLTYSTFIVAILLFICVLISSKYTELQIENLYSATKKKYSSTRIRRILLKNYIDCALENHSITNRKYKLYNLSTVLLIISCISYIIYTCIHFLM